MSATEDQTLEGIYLYELSIKLVETKIRIVATRGKEGGEGSSQFVGFSFKRKEIMQTCRSICCKQI